MRSATSTIWTVTPTALPTLRRRCARCDTPRTFACTGRLRVNANGKRLDAWLLLACTRCGRSLRLPIHERVALRAVTPEELEALHHNDPATVARWAHRLLGADSDGAVPMAVEADVPTTPFLATLRCAPGATLRLDRLLAMALGLSRAEIRRRWRAGWIATVPEQRRALGRRVYDGQRIWIGGGTSPGAP